MTGETEKKITRFNKIRSPGREGDLTKRVFTVIKIQGS